jgi:large subunit ribosomal protein L10
MPISRSEKEALVDSLAEIFGDLEAAVMTDYRGLTVRQISDLRAKLREAGVEYKVIKYTLLNRAFTKAGFEIDLEQYEGPLAIATSTEDAVAPAKILNSFAKENENLKILGGILEGEQVDRAQVIRLASLPSREELYAKMLGSINAPVSNFVGVLGNTVRSVVQVLHQIELQKSE